MPEASTKGTSPEPEIGTLKSKYHKTVVYQGCCRTCNPEWRGSMESRRSVAFSHAVMHAIQVHKWAPTVKV